jgi:hypothetical protein
MNPTRFDRFATAVGQRTTRRVALGLLTALGLTGLVTEKAAAGRQLNGQAPVPLYASRTNGLRLPKSPIKLTFIFTKTGAPSGTARWRVLTRFGSAMARRESPRGGTSSG